MFGPLFEAALSLVSAERVFGSLVLAIIATFIGAYFGGETGAAIAFFATFVLVYGLMLLAPPQEKDKP